MIMEPRIIISFSPLEAMQLERIVLDRDQEEASRMIWRSQQGNSRGKEERGIISKILW